MNKTKLFPFALAALMLGACSSEDVVTDSSKALNFDGDGEMQVTLSFVGGSGTRATEYDEGTEAESKVNDGTFYFYSATTGTFLGQSTASLGTQTTQTDQNVERLVAVTVPATAVEELKNSNNSVKVVVVLNRDDSFNASALGEANDNLLTQPVTVTTMTDEGDDLNFMMTNSVFFDDDTQAASKTESTENVIITSANVYEVGKKPTDYQAVNIYVERVCAKVTLTDAHTDTEGGDAITVLGWGLNVLNTKYYAVKHLSNIFNNLTTPTAAFSNSNCEWNNAVNYRSFWAVDPNYDATSYIVGNADGTDFKIINFADLDKASGASMYCLENTFTAAGQDRDETTTAVILAQFTPAGMTSGATWIKYGGSNYGIDAFLDKALGSDNSVINSKTYYKLNTDGTYSTITQDDFVMTPHVGESGTATEVKNSDGSKTIGYVGGMDITFADGVGTLYTHTGTGTESTDFTAVTSNDDVLDAVLAAIEDYTVYVNGYCYYEVPIRHFNETEVPLVSTAINSDSQLGRYGLVRNNSYKLTVNSITNPGKPIDSETIIPDNTPDDEVDYALDVTINVLSWAVRNQSINL